MGNQQWTSQIFPTIACQKPKLMDVRIFFPNGSEDITLGKKCHCSSNPGVRLEHDGHTFFSLRGRDVFWIKIQAWTKLYPYTLPLLSDERTCLLHGRSLGIFAKASEAVLIEWIMSLSLARRVQMFMHDRLSRGILCHTKPSIVCCNDHVTLKCQLVRAKKMLPKVLVVRGSYVGIGLRWSDRPKHRLRVPQAESGLRKARH